MKKIVLFISIVLIYCMPLSAQHQTIPNQPDTADFPYWIEMMQDHDVNFYDVQRAFNTYWEGREVTKGCGFKPFKRWEYRMQDRIYPDGTRWPVDHIWNEYFKYIDAHPDSRSADGNWTNLGPFNIPAVGKGYQGLGRLSAIAFHPSDADIIYCGAPSGGLWHTTDGGVTWESHTDDLPTLGVSSIIVRYDDPSTILIGTGDPDHGDAAGIGVLISTDGGITWTEWNTGMGNRVVGRMMQHPSNPDIMYAAASSGIYKTTDGGANWVNKQNGNFKDIVFKPNNPSNLYATSGGFFYRSTDDGENWTQINSGLPSCARGVIGVTPANPNYVYFLECNSNDYKGTYLSIDGGLNFSERSTSPNIMSWGCEGGSGGQAWYDLDIAIDPNDENVVYAGGVNCFKSVDGGQTWDISSHWWGDCDVPAVHADLHVMEWNPVDGRLYTGNDGGIYWTADGGTNWTVITDGMPISQVYKIGQSATVKDKVINGYQDNGTSTYFGGNYWEFTRGGDGMECAVDHEDAAYSYATVYYGSIDRYYNNDYQQNVAANGNYGITESGAWITPFILDEEDSKIMYIGYKNVWRCKDVKKSGTLLWDKISDNLAGSNSSNIRVLEQSPADGNILYMSRYDNRSFRTDNASNAMPIWIDLTSFTPGADEPVDIEAHPTDPNIVYMSQSNRIYKSTDKGYSWEDISGTLPDVNYTSIAFYERGNEALYVSSDLGVFYRDASMSDWIWFNQGLPVDASINEIEIYYHPDSIGNDVIRAGTYGRGMWESDMYFAVPEADFTADITIIPPQCGVSFTDLSTGIPFEWEWTFEGGIPATSNEQNPEEILYSTAGTYFVKLVVTNEAGTDSLTYTEYTTVSEEVEPIVDFMVSDSVACTGSPLHMTDQTEYCPLSWHWMFQPDNVEYLEGTDEYSQNPVVSFTEPGTYSVTLIAENSNGTASLTKNDYILYGGYSLPFSEDFESGLSTRSWTVENPDYGITWDISEVAGNEPGTQAAWMNYFDYYVWNPVDRMISPVLNFAGMSNVSLHFQHAYAQRVSLVDSLIIKISDDCGDNWTRVFAGGPDGNGIFATSPNNEEFFQPQTAEDWCGVGWGADCFILDLSQWAGSENIKIMFEGIGHFGNNLYIDNIWIDNSTGMDDITAEVSNADVIVYPNPSTGLFNYSIQNAVSEVTVSVLNLQGQVILNQQFDPATATGTIELSGLAKGIYLVKFANSEFVHLEKVMVK